MRATISPERRVRSASRTATAAPYITLTPLATSLGAPSWSAILADADQLRAGAGQAPLTASDDAVQRDVYSLPAGALAAVTSGPDNGICPVGCAPAAGYDTITGLGSPRAGIDAALAKQ